MKKQSIAIIGVIAFVLAVVVGYALFSDNLTVSLKNISKKYLNN